MVRRLILLLALGGCDLAFGLQRDPVPPVCGPFGAPTEVLFDPVLVDAHDFSVDDTGNFGMVTATAAAPGVPAWVGPHAIKRDASGVWVQDLARDKIILNSFDGAHIITQTEAVGWIDLPRSPSASLIMLSTAWSQVADVLESAHDRSIHIGNVIDLPAGMDKQRFAPEVRPAAENGQLGTIAILQRIPGNSFWTATGQAMGLNVLDPPVDFNGSVLTADHDVLLYTGKVRGYTVSQLFASKRTSDDFRVSVPVEIDGVDGDKADLTEPWVAGACETVYFRWQDKTWTAEAR